MTAARPLPPMTVQLPSRDLTLDDVAELAAADGTHRYELDEGTLIVMPPADSDHAVFITKILLWLGTHGYPADLLLGTPGLRINGQSTGRSPDILVLRRPVPRTVWVDPQEVLLAVEIVSDGSKRLDRFTKPAEYAGVGIPHYWRVERDGGPVTVHMYRLGTGEHGEPAYVGHRAVLFDELLAGDPPNLG